jgi:hypothetical protein
MFDRSADVAVEIDLGVVCLVDESCHCFSFAVSLVLPQELLSVFHCFSCMGIVLSYWLLLVSVLGHIF